MKVNISTKLDVDNMKVNDNDSLEPNEKPDIKEEDEEANFPHKIHYSTEVTKLYHNKKPTTKSPPTPQYDNKIIGNFRYMDMTYKPLEK